MNSIDILEKMKQDDENFMEDVVIYNLEKFIRYCNNSSNFEYDYDFKQHKEVGYLISTLIAENKEKDEEIENQDKTIDRLVKEQEEREKYTHQLEAENKELKEKLEIKKNTPEWEYQYWEARKEVNNEWKLKIKEQIEIMCNELETINKKQLYEEKKVQIYALQSLLGKRVEMEDNYIKPIGETLQDKINLLQEELFKEKEKNKELDKFIKEGITIEPNNPYKNFQLNYLRENFIPKSKVEENLKKAINNEIDLSKAMFEGDFTNGYIYALQSLLGKE